MTAHVKKTTETSLTTEPIRWVCSLCLKVIRQALVASPDGYSRGFGVSPIVQICLPQCCGRDMLLAGEPKRDVWGLREKDIIIDPVDNLTTRR